MDVFTVAYKGLRIAPSLSAMRELMEDNKTMFNVVKILEEGHDAPRKRKEGTVEKWLNKGNKTYNAVVVKSYDNIMKEEIWVLTHFGKFGRKRT